MRHFLTTVIALAFLGFSVSSVWASSGNIYVSETIATRDDENGFRSVVHEFTADGKEIQNVEVPGTFATVSPDGKYIAYMSDNWEPMVLDIKSKTARSLKGINDNKKSSPMEIRKIEWSPDSGKLAFILGSIVTVWAKGHPLVIATYDMKTEKAASIYLAFIDSHEEAFLYPLGWLNGNKSILYAGHEGAVIIDAETGKKQEVSTDAKWARVAGDDKHVYFITYSKEGTTSAFTLKRYSLDTQKAEEIFKGEGTPKLIKVSAGGRYLAYAVESKGFVIVDLKDRKEVTVDREIKSLAPLDFSPNDDNLLLCIMFSGTPSYGTFNIGTGHFQAIMPMTPHEVRFELFTMGFDRSEWR